MKKSQLTVVASAFAAFALLFPCSLMAAKPVKPPKQIVVKIDDADVGAPVVTVSHAPNGYDLYTGPLVANPAIEDGGYITLIGVDQFGPINPGDGGWRFVDGSLPVDTLKNATDIVWIQHDTQLFGNGDLQIGFNTREDGLYYTNPIYTGFDASAGPATNDWVTVYSDATIEVQFKAHTP